MIALRSVGRGRPSSFVYQGEGSLGARIQKALAASGRNASEVSLAIGASEDFVRNIYRKEAAGKTHHPRADFLFALSKELGVEWAWLLTGRPAS